MRRDEVQTRAPSRSRLTARTSCPSSRSRVAVRSSAIIGIAVAHLHAATHRRRRCHRASPAPIGTVSGPKRRPQKAATDSDSARFFDVAQLAGATRATRRNLPRTATSRPRAEHSQAGCPARRDQLAVACEPAFRRRATDSQATNSHLTGRPFAARSPGTPASTGSPAARARTGSRRVLRCAPNHRVANPPRARAPRRRASRASATGPARAPQVHRR